METAATFRSDRWLAEIIACRSTAQPRLLDLQLGAWPSDLGRHPLSAPDDPSEEPWDPGILLESLSRRPVLHHDMTDTDRARLATKAVEPLSVSRSQDGLSVRVYDYSQVFRLALDESGVLDLDSFEGFCRGEGALHSFEALWHPQADVVALWSPSDAGLGLHELELVGLTGLPVAQLPRGAIPVAWVSETALLVLTPIEVRPPSELDIDRGIAWRAEVWRPAD